jgi:hypothetical protein
VGQGPDDSRGVAPARAQLVGCLLLLPSLRALRNWFPAQREAARCDGRVQGLLKSGVALMSREMTDLMTRGSRHDPTLTPLQKAMYSGRMMSLQRRGIDRSSAMLRPSEGFKYWTEHIIMRVARHFDSVIIITGEVGCHAKGQGILMFDGSIKKVEDIAVNDCLMGPEGQSRHVLSLHRGVEDMVRIIPAKAEPFVVNARHLLTTLMGERTVPIVAPTTSNYSAFVEGGWIRERPASDYLSMARGSARPDKLLRYDCDTKSMISERFTVEPSPKAEYFGFQLDGDGRYLMDNFIVTHNSGKSTMALRLAQAFEPGFDIRRLCYSASDLLEAYETVRPGQVVLFDEGSVKGTPILMYDGTLKNVEDIVVGDVVMGPLSEPRNVLSTKHGIENLVSIIPTKNEPFVVSPHHKLTTVKQTAKKRGVNTNDYRFLRDGGWLHDLPAEHYLELVNRQGDQLLSTRALTFGCEEVTLPIPPYVLGLLLADGCFLRKHVGYTKSDEELLRVIRDYCDSRGIHYAQRQKVGTTAKDIVTGRNTALVADLLALGLMERNSFTKFIPSIYKRASQSSRLALLAGLIDGDGSVDKYGVITYSTISPSLRDDIAFVARSLGFRATFFKPQQSRAMPQAHVNFRIGIVGDTNAIPLLVPRKRVRTRAYRGNWTEAFQAEPFGKGEYYCIEVDGDGRYVMGNFIVTHNSVRGLQAGDQSTREQKALIQALVLVREKGAILMLCVPDIFLIAKQIRQKRATLWIHVMERGVALVHERNSYLRYQPDNTLGFTRSRSVPLLEWKPFKTTDKLWIAYQELKRRRLDEYLHETKDLLSGKKKGPQLGETKKEYNARRQRERRERMNGSTSEPAENHDADSTALEDEPKGKNRMQKALEQAAEQPPEVEAE